MSTINFETLLSELIPFVPEAPDLIIIRNIRAALIELCEKASIYQKELDPISSVKGEFEYELDVPAGTTLHEILWVTHDGHDLEPISPTLLEQRKPKWRTTEVGESGTPEFYLKFNASTIYVVPAPSNTTADSIRVRAILKPTHTATSCDAEVMNDYRDAIVNGAAFRLLRTPGHSFTDFNAAQVYGTLFIDQLQDAKERARYGDVPVVKKVKYGGLTSVRGTRKYSGRRLHRSTSF